MTREEAKAAGEIIYAGELRCTRGHTERYVQSGACVQCECARQRNRRPRSGNHYSKRSNDEPPAPVIVREPYSTFINPPTLARLMGGK